MKDIEFINGMSRRTKWTAALGAAALYFFIALYLQYTYVPPPPGDFATLKRPFQSYSTGPTDFAVVASVPELEQLSDTTDRPTNSPFTIYEDGKPLGPAHSVHADIAKLGHGRFSHWTNTGFIFSSSDGSNPQINGHTYRFVRTSLDALNQK
jgi:hypothetical protein